MNKRTGWAEADKALKAVIDAAVNEGVVYVEQELSRLTFDPSGRRTGFEGKEGTKFTAGQTILAAGSETAKVLADSALHNADSQAGHRLVAGAVVVGNNLVLIPKRFS